MAVSGNMGLRRNFSQGKLDSSSARKENIKFLQAQSQSWVSCNRDQPLEAKFRRAFKVQVFWVMYVYMDI